MKTGGLFPQNPEWDLPKEGVPPGNAARKLGDLHLTTRTGGRTIQMDRSISLLGLSKKEGVT